MSKLSSDLLISWHQISYSCNAGSTSAMMTGSHTRWRPGTRQFTVYYSLLWFTPFHLKFPWLFKYLFLFSLTLCDSWVHGKGTTLFVEILYKMFQNGFKFLACNCFMVENASVYRLWLDRTVPCPDAMFRAIISRAQARWREQWLPLM